MSVNLLGDHNLDIDISLIKKTREFNAGIIEEEINLVIPLDLSAIIELTIEDTLLASGIRGVIKINNKFNILDSLGVATKSSDDLFININIVDEELSSTDFEVFQKKIEFLGLIEKTSTASANIQDNVVIFEFEEAFIADLKHTTFESIVGKLEKTGSVEDIIVAAYEQIVPDAKPKDIIAKDGQLVRIGNNLPLTTNLKKPDETIYDRFNILLQSTRLITSMEVPEREEDEEAWADTENFGVAGLLPSFRFSNFNGGRRMILKPYLTDRHREFIEEVREDGIQSKTNEKGNYSDVYTEKFTIGPFAKISGLTDPNTNWHNSLEKYNITRPNIGMLREDVWANYLLVADKTENELFNMSEDEDQDPGTVHQTVITYAEVVEHFINIELNLKGRKKDGVKDGVNLPLVDPKSQAKKILYPSGSKKENKLGRRAIVYNKLAKSFLTVNEQIQFEVKGQVYRTPGKFIWVETQDSDTLLENLWYVNSIKHIIVDGKYTTEVIANRVFGSNTVAAFKQLAKDQGSHTLQRNKKGSAEKSLGDNDSDRTLEGRPSELIEEQQVAAEGVAFDSGEGTDFGAQIALPHDEPSERELVRRKLEEQEKKSAPPSPKSPSDTLPTVPTTEDIKNLQKQNSLKLKEYKELLNKYLTSKDFGTEDLRRMEQLRFELGIKVETVTPLN